MTDDKKKALAIGAVIALIVILLLLFGRKGQTIINRAGPDLGWSLPGLDIDLGDLTVPDLGRYLGVSSCGCAGSHKVTTYQQMPVTTPPPYAGTPPPSPTYQRAAPIMSGAKYSTMTSVQTPAKKPWYFAGGSDGRI